MPGTVPGAEDTRGRRRGPRSEEVTVCPVSLLPALAPTSCIPDATPGVEAHGVVEAHGEAGCDLCPQSSGEIRGNK